MEPERGQFPMREPKLPVLIVRGGGEAMHPTACISALNLSLSRQLSDLMSREEFFAAFHPWLSQWTWFAGRPLRSGSGMDRRPPLYLWNQRDRMDCLLLRSEANTSRKWSAPRGVDRWGT
jgi:hypothetical protein